jgi:putative inorganic carbon (HCO3(-)) transporter
VISTRKYALIRIGVGAAGVLGVFMIAGLINLVEPLFVLAAIAAVALAATVLTKPWIGVLALVVILPFNGLISQLLGEGAAATGYGAAKDALLFLLLIATLMTKRIRRIPVEMVVIVTILAGAGILGSLMTPELTQALYGWRNDFEPVLLLLSVPAVMTPHSIRKVTTVAVALLQLTALIGILTWTRGLEWMYTIGRLPVAEGERFPTSFFSAGSIEPRAFSPYTAPNEMAAATVVLLAMVWCRADWSRRRKFLLSILPVTVVVLSGSRSGLLGLLLLAGVLMARALYFHRKDLAYAFLVVGGLGGAVLAILFLTSETTDPSLGGHAVSLLDTLPVILQNPFGLGVGQVGPRAALFGEAEHVESFWLLLALEAGIFVLLLFVVLIVRVSVLGIKGGTLQSFLAPAAIAGTIVSQLVLPTLQEGAVSYTLWIAAATHARQERAAEALVPQPAITSA